MGKTNAAKTHCPAGHPYDEQNTYRNAKGWRRCRACHNGQVKASYVADPQPVRERRRQERIRDGARIDARRRERDAERIDEIRAQSRARYGDRKRSQIYFNRQRITPEEWTAIWQAQGGCCYLCGHELPSNRKQVHLDHDHRCCPPGRSCPLCRRGLACNGCNAAIGHAKDDPERLRRMADALGVANAAVTRRIAEHADRLVLFEEKEVASCKT